jgi:hypothetical protein
LDHVLALFGTAPTFTPQSVTSYATTGTSGTGTTATITYSGIAFGVGTSIGVFGVTPTGYNGVYTVTASAANTVSYANTTTGSQSVAGTVTASSPNQGWGINVEWPMLCGAVDYPISPFQGGTQANTNYGQKVFIVAGLASPGGVTVSGAQPGDCVLWATDLTTPADVTSSFARIVTGAGTIQQTGSALNGKNIQICLKSPQFLTSNHRGFSYGFNLTTTNVPNLMWRYIGGSLTVYCNYELAALMFPGLYVGLNNGSGVTYYLVMSVYPRFGYPQGGGLPYFTIQTGFGSSVLAGTVGTVYTSVNSPHGETAIIYQQPFVLNVA